MALPARARATSVAPKPAVVKTAPAPAMTHAEETEVTVPMVKGVTVHRHFTMPLGDGEFVKFGVIVEATTYDAATELVDTCMLAEAEKAGAQYREIQGTPVEDAVEGAEEADASEGAEEAVEEAAAEGGEAMTADDLEAMDRPTIEALIEEHGLDVDPAEHPKTKAGLTSLRAAVGEIVFAEEASVDADTIMAMDRAPLIAFIKENDLTTDPKKHPKLSTLRVAVVEELTAAAADGGEAEEVAEEVAEEAGEATDEGYTEAALTAMAPADLKAIFEAWDIDDGKVPAGPPAVAKKLAIKRILAFQTTGE